MKAKPDHFIIRVAKYGYDNQEFTSEELVEKKIITDKERGYVLPLVEASGDNPNKIAKFVGRNAAGLNLYTLLPSAVFSYADHLELQFAQRNAREAKRYSLWAIMLSVMAVLIEAFDVFIKS